MCGTFLFFNHSLCFILLACEIKPEKWTRQGRGFTVFKFKSLFMRKKGSFVWLQCDFPAVTNNRVLIKVLGEGGCCDLRMSNVYERTFSPSPRPSPSPYFYPSALGTESQGVEFSLQEHVMTSAAFTLAAALCF